MIGSIIGAVVGGAVSAFGAGREADAAERAGEAELLANRETLEYLREKDEQARADMAPLRRTSKRAAKAYGSLFGLSEAPEGFRGFERSPGYGFRKRQGRAMIEGSAAARGGLLSGRTGTDLIEFGQDYASNEWNAWADRLAGLASGVPAAASRAPSSDTTARVMLEGGRAAADSITNQSNAWSNATTNLGEAFGIAGGAFDEWRGGSRGGFDPRLY